MNSTRNPQYQTKSNVDIVPDIEPQIDDAVADGCSQTSTSATAGTIPPNLSKSTTLVDDNAASLSQPLGGTVTLPIFSAVAESYSQTSTSATAGTIPPNLSKSTTSVTSVDDNAAALSQPVGGSVTHPIFSAVTDQPPNDAAASNNHESTLQKDKSDDSVKMGPSIIHVDVLEKVESDAGSLPSGSFLINGEYHVHRRYQNPGFCSRHSQQRAHQSNINATATEAKGVKSDDNGRELEEVDDGRRRSGRKRKSAYPANSEPQTGSKVKDVEVLQPKQSFVIVELPDDASPGDSFMVSWPRTADELHYDDSPQFYLFEVPQNVASPTKNKTRLLKVMAPGFYGPPDKKGRSGVDANSRGSPQKTSALRSFQSPQKAEWFSYRKTSSRVGKLYQVPSLPPAGTAMKEDDSMETTVEGYGTLWDCRLAEQAERNGERLEAFLDLLPKDRVMLMEILHRNAYNVQKAEADLLSALRTDRSKDLSPFNSWETEAFARFIMEDFGSHAGPRGAAKPYFSKRFTKIAQHLGRSVNACLRHYYTRYKKGPQYKDLKTKIWQQKEACSDETQDSDGDKCVICDDVGELISCDQCFRDFHRMCLRPPLWDVPEGDWFCPDCQPEIPKASNEVAFNYSELEAINLA